MILINIGFIIHLHLFNILLVASIIAPILKPIHYEIFIVSIQGK